MGWIMKLDSSGTKIWERFYTNDNNPEAPNFIYDFVEKGGIACVGMGHTSDTTFGSKAGFWLLVLDSMGCLIPGCDTITGIAPITENAPLGARVYPNPASNQLTISVPIEDGGYRLVLFNLLGQEVLQTAITDAQTNIPLNLPSGIYVYRITHGNAMQTGKLVVE